MRQWFSNQSLTTKSIVAFTTLIVFFLGLNLVVLVQMRNIRTLSNEIARLCLPKVYHLSALNAIILNYRISEMRHILERTREAMQAQERSIAKERERMKESAALYHSLLSTDNEKQAFAEFQAQFQQYNSISAKILALSRTNSSAAKAEAQTLMFGEHRTSFNQFSAALLDISEQNVSVATGTSDNSDVVYERAVQFVVASLLASVGMLAVIGFWALVTFVRPIRVLASAADAVAKGDTTVSVKVRSRDEIGLLSRSFNAMVSSIHTSLEDLRQQALATEAAAHQTEIMKQHIERQQEYLAESVEIILRQMEHFSEGDLTVELPTENHSDEIRRLFTYFNCTVMRFRRMIEEVSNAAAQALAVSEEISFGTEELSSGLHNQTLQITNIAAAIEQMATTIADTTKQTDIAAREAKQTNHDVEYAATIGNDAIERIRSVTDVVLETAAQMEQLRSSGEQIGSIVETIEEIADQTNLLALNTAIEAARAGEHGRLCRRC